MRVGDLLLPESEFEAKCAPLVAYHNFLLEQYYHAQPVPLSEVVAECMQCAVKINPLITDVSAALHDAIASGANILCEGAQGALLDIDHGTYPYVTSSNTIAGAVALALVLGLRLSIMFWEL